jgi:hypothetical protein
VQTQFTLKSHPSEDFLEEYAFRRLNEEQIAPLEEHLLLCSECQEALTEIDEYVILMKTATANFRASPVRASPFKQTLEHFKQLFLPAFGWRVFAWTAAGVMACLLAVAYVSLRTAVAPVAVALTSFRGGESLGNGPHAPAKSPLQLQIDPADSPLTGSYRVEVVTIEGRPVWTGEPRVRNGKLEAAISPGLARGLYWVRLYAAASAEPLSESPLRVD